MSDPNENHNDSFTSGHYEIRLKGQIPSDRAAWFEGMTIVSSSDDQTVLQGEFVDQSSLHGVLNKIRDLNIVLLSVERLDDD